MDYDIPPCAAYWGADAVFTGLVTGVTPVSSESWGSVGGDVVVRFAIEQAFRGIKETKVEVVSHGESSSCNMGFEVGQRWLVYAYRPSSGGRLGAGPCSRTTQLPADEDLAYITGLAKSPIQSILGRVGKSRYETLEGVKVVAEGRGNKYQALTDKEGKFNIDLPQAGAYKVRLFIPYSAYVLTLGQTYEEIKSDPTEALTVAEYDVNVPAGRCDYRLITAPEKDLKATAEISGKVVDSEGRSVPSLTIYLYPATPDQKFSSGDYKFTQTDVDGNYQFTELREGNYWLGINIGRMPEVGSPYPTTYHPNVQDINNATPIALRQGQKLSKRDIQLPPKLIEREIEGKIVWPDGRPALAPPPDSKAPGLRPDITVRDPRRLWYPLNPRRADGTWAEKVDDKGNFSFIGFEGHTYVITASGYDAEGKQAHSKALKLKISGRAERLVLVLSLPGHAGEAELKKELGDGP